MAAGHTHVLQELQQSGLDPQVGRQAAAAQLEQLRQVAAASGHRGSGREQAQPQEPPAR